MNLVSLINTLGTKTIVITKSKGNLNILETELGMTREVNRDVSKINESGLSLIHYKSIITGIDLSPVKNAVFVNFTMDEFNSPEMKQLLGRFNRINSPITNTIVISHIN